MAETFMDPAALFAGLDGHDERFGKSSMSAGTANRSIAVTAAEPLQPGTSAAASTTSITSSPIDGPSFTWTSPAHGSGFEAYPNGLKPDPSAPLLQQAWSFTDGPVDMGPPREPQYPPSSNANSQTQPAVTGFPLTTLYGPPAVSSADYVSHGLPMGMVPVLTPAQQEKLKALMMPSSLQFPSPTGSTSPDSAHSLDGKRSSSSPDVKAPPRRASRKRKPSTEVDEDEDEDEDDDSPRPAKKTTTHNMIEKRYRNNLNDKIAALRDSVPSLRIMSKTARGEDVTEDKEELHGLAPAHKLNKATVLSKATEYIRHLEKRNGKLAEENSSMVARIKAFERMFMSGTMTGTINTTQHPTTTMPFTETSPTVLSTPISAHSPSEPPGMIAVPDDMKRILAQQMVSARAYPVPPQHFQQTAPIVRQQQIRQEPQHHAPVTRGWSDAGPYFGRLMVGSLAGLMLLEAVRENEQSNEKTDGRGLFAVPVQLLSRLVSSSHVSIAGHHISGPQLLHTAKFLIVLGLFLWFFIPSLFSSKPSRSHKTRLAASIAAAPSLASPIHIRRQAWLTAVQTVWVPQHNFFLEAAALMLKTLKLSVRSTMGAKGYQLLTGLSEEQEQARVKAWTIALDAQLAGGDVEINKSRLTLTLLASGTLPDTPQRLMLKALHTRVLLWQQGRRGLLNPAFRALAFEIAKAMWTGARQLDRIMSHARKASPSPADEDLPEHLAVLLQQDCRDVLSDDIVQRAFNLAWNYPTTTDAAGTIDGMGAVVDDTAVRSPLDAAAAWYSCSVLHRALTTVLEAKNATSLELQAMLQTSLDTATQAAPIGSNAQVRALVARAVFLGKDRATSIGNALQAMRPSSRAEKQLQQGVGMYSTTIVEDAPVLPTAAETDAQMALHCAIAVNTLERHATNLPQQAVALVASVVEGVASSDMSLLGCAAALGLLSALDSHATAAEACPRSLERLAGSLRIWLGSEAGEKCGLDANVRRAMIARCLDVAKRAVGMTAAESGYGSMSDCCEDEDEVEAGSRGRRPASIDALIAGHA